MIRNLKALGLALVAVFAMSAVAASAASAQQGVFTTDGTGATLDITETGPEGANALTFAGNIVECPGSTYDGHELGSTTKPVPNKATTATITPTYKQPCKAKIGTSSLPATVFTNGCDYVFHIGTTTPEGNKEGTYGVTADIVCPKEKDIEVKVYAGSSHLVVLCSVTVKPQNGLTGAHLTSTGPPADDIDVTGTFGNFNASQSGSGCVTKEEEAKFDIDATVKGTNAEGGETGVTITDS